MSKCQNVKMSTIYPTSLLQFIGLEIEPDYTTAQVVILLIPFF
ncbi:hypothetical protein [Okeania sp. SIO3I5]|nr:hypothetical protein [Okeania sp. SIO3I5]